MITRRSILLAPLAALLAAGATVSALAQSYPNHPIRMIVPYPPGGPIDTMGRLVAQQLSARLG